MGLRTVIIREILATFIAVFATVVVAFLIVCGTLFISLLVMGHEYGEDGMAFGPVIGVLYGLGFAILAATWYYLVRLAAWKFHLDRKIEGSVGFLLYVGFWLVLYASVAGSFWNIETIGTIFTLGVTFVVFWLVHKLVLEILTRREEGTPIAASLTASARQVLGRNT